MHQIQAIVTGHVQDIGFRYFAMQKAKALGITGNVKNLADGSVEVNAQGEKNKLEELIEALKEGPSHATIKEVEVNWVVAGKKFEGFTVEY